MKTIWSLLVIYIPKPEIEEITRIIGKKAIDKNEELCLELQSLKDVVTDFLSLQFDQVNIVTNNHTSSQNNNHNNNKNNINNHSLSINNQLHIDVQRSYTSKNSECSSHTLEIVDLVKDSMTLNKIHQVVNVIRQAIANEKDEIEAEIQVLQTSMDTESEMISRGNTPRSDQSNHDIFEINHFPIPTNSINSIPECSYCGKLLNLSNGGSSSPVVKGKSLSKTQSSSLSSSSILSSTSTSSNLVSKPSRTNTKLSSKSKLSASLASSLSFCPYCSATPSRPSSSCSMKPSILSLTSPSKSTPVSTPTTSTPIITTATTINSSKLYQEPVSRPGTSSGSGVSRMRSKLQAARDEKHFLDEDIFTI